VGGDTGSVGFKYFWVQHKSNFGAYLRPFLNEQGREHCNNLVQSIFDAKPKYCMILRPLAVACTAISLKLAHVESNKALIVQGSSVYSLVCTDISNQLEGLYKEE
jgi:hypothetical protein